MLIIYDGAPHLPPAGDPAMAPAAKRKLHEMVESAETSDQTDRGRAFGNRAGFALLRDGSNLQDRLHALEQNITELRSNFQSQFTELRSDHQFKLTELRSDHQSQLTELQRNAGEFRVIRGRWLEHAHHKLTGKPLTNATIEAGNDAAHQGNAMADMVVYEKQQRTDDDLYVTIYGLSPQEVRNLGKPLELLDAMI